MPTARLELPTIVTPLCIIVFLFLLIFFFSSIRRHTRSLRDWSSDVCSSDLPAPASWLSDVRTSAPPHGTFCKASEQPIGNEGNQSECCEPAHHLAGLQILLRDLDPVDDAGEGAGELGRDERVEGDADRGAQPDHDVGQR